MLEAIFQGVFDNGLEASVNLPEFLLCVGV